MCEDGRMEQERQEAVGGTRFIGTVAAAWAVATLFGVLVIILVPGHHRAYWLLLAIGASVLVAFFLQLGTAEKQGFITRTSISVAGSVLIIAVIDLVHLLVR